MALWKTEIKNIQPCIIHFAEIWCNGKLRSMDVSWLPSNTSQIQRYK